MPVTKALTGNYAVAEAARLCGVQVVGFYPIGPSDEVVEEIVRLVGKGRMRTKILDLENERSVMNALILASESGARTLFASNSEGLYFAAQQIKHAAPARAPLVLAVANRALEPPAIVTPDYQDTVSFRDCHWLQFYCENPQDVLDTVIQAYRVAEDPAVMLPAFVCYEGWEVSHSTYTCTVPDPDDVRGFVPPFHRPAEEDLCLLNYREMYRGRTFTEGSEGLGADDYMERRYRLMKALEDAADVITSVSAEYGRLTGRDYGGVIEAVECDDAEVVLLTMGAVTATARLVVKGLRDAGRSVGMIKLRCFRPFPAKELMRHLAGTKVVVVAERDISAAVTHELRSALYDMEAAPRVLGRLVGIGGRDVTLRDVLYLAEEGLEAARSGKGESLRWHFGDVETGAKAQGV